MNLTKNTRRLAAALAVPVLLFTAACGSDDDGGSSDSGAAVTVKGKFGEKPEITVPKDAKAGDKLVTETLVEGKGDKVEKDGFLRADFVAHSLKDGKMLGSSWDAPGQKPDDKAPRRQEVVQIGKPGQSPLTKVAEALVGQKAGSRVEVQGTVKETIGEQVNPQLGLQPDDGLVWIVDVVGAQKVDAKAEAKGEQAKPDAGMPEAKADGQKAAEITIPKDEKAPADLKEQVLIKGTGPEVKAGDGLIAQYTGVKWEDGKKFDSSWDHGGATAFQIGTGSVVQGWDKGLVGKRVGDRVELVIPPGLAYGGQQGSELAKNTLVFIVDIVGKV
ncbi:FKBP-type peptidyl-prolyl cis-trans isomerase [Streptomyces stramineus]|uniref:peptidylprolyl isomerase n=1 Tax=Streptomyces stramineus TaxID=173861 RepID=A0ABN1B2R1_9ACTN